MTPANQKFINELMKHILAYDHAAQQAIELVEGWQNGIFQQVGITWLDDPPAIRKLKELSANRPSAGDYL